MPLTRAACVCDFADYLILPFVRVVGASGALCLWPGAGPAPPVPAVAVGCGGTILPFLYESGAWCLDSPP